MNTTSTLNLQLNVNIKALKQGDLVTFTNRNIVVLIAHDQSFLHNLQLDTRFSGTVIYSKYSYYPVGHFRNDWENKYVIPFLGEVAIRSEP